MAATYSETREALNNIQASLNAGLINQKTAYNYTSQILAENMSGGAIEFLKLRLNQIDSDAALRKQQHAALQIAYDNALTKFLDQQAAALAATEDEEEAEELLFA